MKIYLDNNIVSAIAKDDEPAESDPLDRLLIKWDWNLEKPIATGTHNNEPLGGDWRRLPRVGGGSR
jgi:hypothetical protein